MQESNPEILLAEIDIDPRAAAAELCKRKLSFFVQEFWDIVIEEDMEWSNHMEVLCDEIQAVYMRVIGTVEKDKDGEERRVRLPKLYDLIINIPPGTSKSTICTVMAPPWSWANDPSLRHMTGSYSETLSMEHAVKSRDIVRSELYKLYFPEVRLKKDEDNKTNYKTTRKGQRIATSIGGTATGMHAHIITIDDPLSPKEAASAADVLTANTFFDRTLPTRKVDKRITPTILVMQRLDSNDPTGHLLEKKKTGIRHVCLPGTVGDNISPAEYVNIYTDGFLDPVRLGKQVLDELRIDLGSYGYAGQIDQRPVPSGGLIWQKWFKEVPDELFPDIAHAKEVGTDWDLAYTKDDENAASAYIVSGTINERIYIFDFDWKWLEFPELVKWMRGFPSPHYIEAKASGKSAKQVLTKQRINAIEVAIKGGSDKIARARMATPTAEAGRVYIKKSMADKMYNDSKQGILFFPKGNLKDLADTLAQCLQRHNSNKKFTVAKNSGTDIRDGDEEENPLDWIDD